METHTKTSAWDNKTHSQLKIEYELMEKKLEARRATCRKSSKQYYDKTFKLKINATPEEVEKNKSSLMKRDSYQKSYYLEHKEKIRIKQKSYREQKKQKAKEEKELTTLYNNEIHVKNYKMKEEKELTA